MLLSLYINKQDTQHQNVIREGTFALCIIKSYIVKIGHQSYDDSAH